MLFSKTTFKAVGSCEDWSVSFNWRGVVYFASLVGGAIRFPVRGQLVNHQIEMTSLSTWRQNQSGAYVSLLPSAINSLRWFLLTTVTMLFVFVLFVYFFTCRILRHWLYQAWPWLIGFNGVVLSCLTLMLSHSNPFTEVTWTLAPTSHGQSSFSR